MAQGFALVFWAVSFLPVTLVGVVAIWREGLDLRSLREEGLELASAFSTPPDPTPDGPPSP